MRGKTIYCTLVPQRTTKCDCNQNPISCRTCADLTLAAESEEPGMWILKVQYSPAQIPHHSSLSVFLVATLSLSQLFKELISSAYAL